MEEPLGWTLPVRLEGVQEKLSFRRTKVQKNRSVIGVGQSLVVSNQRGSGKLSVRRARRGRKWSPKELRIRTIWTKGQTFLHKSIWKICKFFCSFSKWQDVSFHFILLSITEITSRYWAKWGRGSDDISNFHYLWKGTLEKKGRHHWEMNVSERAHPWTSLESFETMLKFQWTSFASLLMLHEETQVTSCGSK